MSRAIAVVTADTHLSPQAWVKYPGLCGDSYYSLRQITEYALEYGLPVILAGDVFDKTRPDPNTVAVTNECINKLAAANLHIYYIQGQHELDRNSPWLSAINPWPIHINKKIVSVNGINVYGLDWTPTHSIDVALVAIPDTDVFVGHQVWQELLGQRIGEGECSFSSIVNARLTITGDFHKHVEILVQNGSGMSMRVISPGSTCMQSISENPLKYCHILYDDLTLTKLPLKTRNCYRFMLSNDIDVNKFISTELEEALKPQTNVYKDISKNILHIQYDQDVLDIYHRLVAAVENKAHLFMSTLKMKRSTVMLDNEDVDDIEIGLESCLEFVIQKGTDLHRDLLALLRSQNPKDTLDSIKSRYIERRCSGDRRGLQIT